MNEFVEECRREWRRLGVPDRVIEEMAAELAADLEEAEADGVSAGEALGRGASDARSFAADWATERGVTRQAALSTGRFSWRFAIAAATAAFAAMAISGAVLVAMGSRSAPERLSLPAPAGIPALADVRATQRVYVGPPLRIIEEPMEVPAREATPGTIWVRRLPPDAAATAQVGALEIRIAGAHDDSRTVGWVLLIVGLAGAVLLTLLASGIRAGGPLGRRTAS